MEITMTLADLTGIIAVVILFTLLICKCVGK